MLTPIINFGINDLDSSNFFNLEVVVAKKMVFVAHPMSGDIEGNTQKVIEICLRIHSSRVIPVFPSLVWRRYLGNSKRDKRLERSVNKEYFRRGFIDELWLYGDRITDGMKREIELAFRLGILVIPRTRETGLALKIIRDSLPRLV